MRLGIRAKLFLISLGLIALALIIGYGYLASVLDRSITKRISDEMAVRLELAARVASQADLSPGNQQEWQAQAAVLSQLTRARATLLDGNGEVMGDSDVAAGVLHKLENHHDRPEILDAFARGRGVSTRKSRTLGQRMHYVAMAFEKKGGGGRGIVRLALPLVEVDHALGKLHVSFAIAALLALSVAGFMSSFAAHFAARSVRNLTATARRMVGGELGVRASKLDADEVAMLGRDLDELAERLRRLESLRRDFVANVSHELRTPVTALRSAAETLRIAAARDPEAAPRFLDIIERNAERMHQMVEDLLDLSRIESHQFRLNSVTLALPELSSHLLEMFHSRSEAKALRMSIEMPSDLPAVRVDRRALEQVLVNLIDNAIKYCPTGAAIALRAAPQGKKWVRVSVADTGPGIEARHLPRLFERFYRVDAGRSRELGGTGLGLAIVKHLVEAMGGRVQVESEVGAGSVFSFTIPRANKEADSLME